VIVQRDAALTSGKKRDKFLPAANNNIAKKDSLLTARALAKLLLRDPATRKGTRVRANS
jgi:hypothetical protein